MVEALTTTYQRSQVEQAIARVEGLALVGGAVPTALRSNVKRLLDIDRKPRAKKLDAAPECLAFYDQSEAPGHGVDVLYRPYHAFALLIGIRLIASGMPQSRAVMLLRALRDDLEPTFEGLASTSPSDLRPGLTEAEVTQLARNGYLLHNPKTMTFLIARAGPDAEALLVPRPDRREFVTGNVCTYDDFKDRLRFFSHEGQAVTVVELTNAIFKLLYVLPRTIQRRRGRH